MVRNYIAACIVCLNLLLPVLCFRTYTKDDIFRLREEVREMFQHAYDGYLKYAGNYDELRPLSCDGVDTWGSYSLTLIDALDTLAVMGNYSEFRRVVDILTQKTNYDADINVSVFETNIRIVGGLLGAHLMSLRAGVDVEPGWPCNGLLLRLAEDVAKRLLPAFDSKTGMPYGTVNLRHGVPAGETTVTCTAGVGTFIVEFGALSRLTGDPIYEEVALNALYALWRHRSPIGLFGNHIDVQTGRWTAQDAGIGAGVDSYYEYLVKGALMLNRPELLEMFHTGRKAIDKYLKRDDWHVWVSMNKGQVTLPVFQSLEAYWPGVLSLIGDIGPAMKTLHNYHSVWKQYGFLPEFYNIQSAEAGANRENYPLRPELIESVMYLYRATSDPYLLEVGEDMLRSIQYSAKTSCGYATIKNVRDHRKEDRMESFFLAETTKYLYLLFDPENFLHNDGREGTLHETPNGMCVIHAGGYIFNTEAHPIDPSALRCCHDNSDWFKDYKVEKFLGEELKKREEKDFTTRCASDLPNLQNFESLTIDIDTSPPDSKDLMREKIGEKIKILKQLKNESFDKIEKEKKVENLYKLYSKMKNNEDPKVTPKKTLDAAQAIEKILIAFEPVIKMNEKFFASETLMLDKVTLLEVIVDEFIKAKNISIEDITKDVNITLLENEVVESEKSLKEWLDSYDRVIFTTYLFNTVKALHSLQKLRMESSGYNVIKEVGNLVNSLKHGEDESILKSMFPELMTIFTSSQENYEKRLARKHFTVASFSYTMYLQASDPLAESIGKIATVIEIIKEKKRHFENRDKQTKPLNLELLENVCNLFPEIDGLDQSAESTMKLENPTEEEKTEFEARKKQSDDIILVDESSKNSKEKVPDSKLSEETVKEKEENVVLKTEQELDSEENTGKGSVEPVHINDEQESLTKSDSKSEYQSSESSHATDNLLPAIQQYIEDPTNDSLFTDFIQTILKSALPKKPKFEPQLLLEKIRANGVYNNQQQNFELLTCRAQPFLQRVSINGEFF